MRKIFKDCSELLLSVLFPRRCAICDRTIAGNRTVCDGCSKGIKLIEDPTCMKCGKTLVSEEELFCYDCKRTYKAYDRGFAVFEYSYIKNSLYRFKYASRAEYSRFYAEKTIEKYGDLMVRLGIEAFIPVPIHRKRQEARGYNQSYEYAKVLSELTHIPVDSKLILRQINTIPLKKLRPNERQKNLKKAFKLNRNDVKFRRVCIVDDIYTTGATISSIAELLKSAGVTEVYFMAIAIGTGL